MNNVQNSASEDLRLFDLFMRFKQGDEGSFSIIMKRFKGLIEKESFNIYLGTKDEDLRAQIYVALFIRLQRYEIPDAATLNIQDEPIKQGEM